jgi:hypothetical protein
MEIGACMVLGLLLGLACAGADGDDSAKDTAGSAGDAAGGDGGGADRMPEQAAEVLPTPDLYVGPPADYLIITADDLLDTAEAFADFRVGQGYTVVLTTGTAVAGSAGQVEADAFVEAAQDWIAYHHDRRNAERPLFLLLVGDADAWEVNPAETIPVKFWSGGWESAYSDNFYGDVNGDHVPELAVGRIPVANNEDGLRILGKIKQHETQYEVGPWNHRLSVYAGEGGFAEGIDLAIETVAQKGLEAVPYDFDLSFAYNNPDSSYYYSPFEEKVLDLIVQGSVLVTYMGHGGGELNVPSLDLVLPQHRFPMCAFFACGTGDYVGAADSDPEVVMKQAGGPMALLVSQTTTHPYGNAVDALELESAVFVDLAPTFGEAVTRMKWRSLNNDDDFRKMVDELALLYVSQDEMDDVIRDHLYSYNLLGDPAIAMRLPAGKVELTAGDGLMGAPLPVSGTVSNLETGTVHIRLVCLRASILHPLTPVENPLDPGSQATIQENWEKAMDHNVAEAEAPIAGSKFTAELAIPASGIPAGTYYVTAYAEDGTTDASGSLAVHVKK